MDGDPVAQIYKFIAHAWVRCAWFYWTHASEISATGWLNRRMQLVSPVWRCSRLGRSWARGAELQLSIGI